MAWYPQAVRKPLDKTKRAMTPRRVNLHTGVTNGTSLFGYFSSQGVYSHFYVRKDGTVEQYQDTRYRAACDLDGNPDTISIESWDGGGYASNAPGYWDTSWDVPPWNPAQVAAIVKLVDWIFDTHPSIPRKRAIDNMDGPTSHGLSWHRLGVAGFAKYSRLQGGLIYSTSYKKACPGDRRIAQIPGIFAQAIGGSNVTTTTTTKAPQLPSTGDVWDGKSYPGSEVFRIGVTHPATTLLGQRLVLHGFGKHYKEGPGPKFSEADRLNVQEFQLAQGWTGTEKGGDADGYPGPVTWTRLMAEPTLTSKSIATMAQEVIDGKHGSGHDVRMKSLGVDRATYEKVRAEVNRRVYGKDPVPAAPKPVRTGKTISQMALEVIAGKHGTGHETRRKSLGIDKATYEKVRAEVNRRV